MPPFAGVGGPFWAGINFNARAAWSAQLNDAVPGHKSSFRMLPDGVERV